MNNISKMIFKNNKIIVKLLAILLIIICISFAGICVYSFQEISKYDDRIYPNLFINSYDISGKSKKDLKKLIENIEQDFLNSKVKFVANEKTYEYTAKDLSISINKDKLYNDIIEYQDNLTFSDKVSQIITLEKQVFSYEILYDEEKLNTFLTNLKLVVDCDITSEKLVMDKDRNLNYVPGKASFNMNIEESKEYLIENIYNLFINGTVELKGTSINATKSNISTINKKISTYTTKFNNKISRGKNLKTGAKYIDGVVVQPGKTFDFYSYAGPYGKEGYVWYSGVLGNGVCQVASALYNTTLLAGLKVTQRVQHAEQMPYVEGNLDATVGANLKGPTANYKFKNIYKYPVYISAFTNGGELTIEFWSNENATEGKTYKTETEKIGSYAFKSYLLTYKDGQLISKKHIATNYYKGLLYIE